MNKKIENYTSEENTCKRVEIWNKIKYLSKNENLCEIKLQELFKYKNFNTYFQKFERIISYLNIYINPKPLKDKIIFCCLDALKEYEFFYSCDINKNKYDSNKLKQELENLKKFYISNNEIAIKIPKHPNDILKDTYQYLVNECNFNKYGSKKLIEILFHKDKKISYSKQTEKEYRNIPKIFEDIKYSLIKYPHLNEGFKNLSKFEQEKVLIDLDSTVLKWKIDIEKILSPLKLK